MSAFAALSLVIALAALIAGAVLYARNRGPRRIRRLRARYLQLLHLPRGQAEETLLTQLENLSERHPGQTMEWYLSWLIESLRRDRR